MKPSLTSKILTTTLATALLASVSAIAAKPAIITIDGSSTVYPVTEAVAEEFQQKQKGVRVTVGISGTGGGFKKFCKGETDISNASRPISKEEMALCKTNGVTYYELPVAFDALTVVTNPKNSFASSMTVAELKKVWEPAAQGQVKNWSQVRAGWPDQPITLYGAGSDSGTFDYFTEAVVGKAKSQRGDYTASEDDNVIIQGVSKDANALGYIPYSYYSANPTLLKAVNVDGGAGPIAPSHDTVINGTYTPLSRPLFVYVSEKASKKPEVANFVKFYLTEGVPLISEVKYVPLPATTYPTVLARFGSTQTGTGFAGEAKVGMRVDDILKLPPVH